MLAEPRRKQRISVDPQNVTWKNAETIGKKIMSAHMNWSEGKGLGKNEQGSAENLKLNPNFTGKGLGCDRNTRNKQQWISHHDEFATILANLNKSAKQEFGPIRDDNDSIQTRSRSMKTRVHYKFTRGKDLTLATQKQKMAIFGIVNRVEPQNKSNEASIKKEEINQTRDNSISTPLHVSAVSVSDYYKERMAKWIKKEETISNDSTDLKPDQIKAEAEVTKKAKSRKRRKRIDTEESP